MMVFFHLYCLLFYTPAFKVFKYYLFHEEIQLCLTGNTMLRPPNHLPWVEQDGCYFGMTQDKRTCFLEHSSLREQKLGKNLKYSPK